MATNLNVLRSVEEMQQDVVITYAPFFLTLKNQKAWETAIEEQKLTKIAGSDADIEARLINSQDTEIKQTKANKSSKVFNKQIFLLEYLESNFQKDTALPQLNNRVIKNMSKQLDYQVWNGTHNNGLFVSSDPNYVTNTAATLPAAINGNNGIDALAMLFNLLQQQVDSTTGSGDVLAAIYGKDLLGYLRKLFPATGTSYLDIIKANYPNITPTEVPTNLASTDNGILIVSQEMVESNHQALPQIYKAGVDERKSEAWVQYIFGTAFIDVMDMGGIIKQPVTIG